MRVALMALLILIFVSNAGMAQTYSKLKVGNTTFDLEVAKTPEEREKGLMFRPSISPTFGMLFIFPEEEKVSFWMRNTWVYLDIIWISANGEIVSIHERAIPGDETPLSPSRPASYVLEVAGGTVSRCHITEGQTVTFIP